MNSYLPEVLGGNVLQLVELLHLCVDGRVGRPQLLQVLQRLGLLVDLVLEVLGHHGLVQVGVEEEGRQVQVDLLRLLPLEDVEVVGGGEVEVVEGVVRGRGAVVGRSGALLLVLAAGQRGERVP